MFEPFPDDDILQCWSALEAFARREEADAKRVQGRLAEKLSFEHERARLRRLGIVNEPRWVSLDDNYLGYDILSFDMRDGMLVQRLIEVKSSSRVPPRLILTRNEWKRAQRTPNQCVIHLWKMPGRDLTEVQIDEFAGHVPQDCGSGTWQSVEILWA
jgi:hypothetical protein